MNEAYLIENTKEELIEMLVNETDATRELLNNWNELKKWLEDKDNNGYEKFYVEDMLILMQELEQGKDE